MAMTPILKPQWFQILLALADHELHGLGIMKEVLEQTDGQMRLWPAMLYGSLKKMVDAGFVEEREGPVGPGADSDRRRFYGITGAGRVRLAAEVARLARYVRVAERKDVLGDTPAS
jgi:DNA-binding PadR family transcriptional regulator